MFKVWCSCLLFVLVCGITALDPEKCQEKPQQKHCLIEWRVRDRWPHKVRYVYDWYTRRCFEIRWSDHCPPVPPVPKANNWASETECLNECSGWA